MSETILPYIFILGNPIIHWHGIYAENNEKRESDMKILIEITTEFRDKQQSELESEQKKLADQKAKIASIIYSTG